MVRGVARLVIAAMATALLGIAQPFLVGATASQPLHGGAYTRTLLARSAPGSPTALPKPNQRGRLGIATALVAGVGPNIQVSPVDNNDYSTTAATYDPTDHANLFAGANIVTAAPVAGFVSGDSGSSWAMNTMPFANGGPASFEFYPGAAFSADGFLYASFMAYGVTGNTLSTQIVVAKSFDKGKTWTLPNAVEQSATTPEKPLIAVDTTSSPYRNRIYVGYDTNPAHGSEPLVVSHSDDGITWTRAQIADTGGDFGAAPAVGPNGEAYVAWDDWCSSNGAGCTLPGHILLAKSTDGGVSWISNGPVASTSIGFQGNVPNYSNGCSNPPVNPNPAPSIDVDRSGGVHNGSVYVAWGDQQSGGFMRIYYSRSTDGGAHFSTPVLIDTGNSSGDAWQPAVSVDQSNGAVAIGWYDRRDDPGNRFYRPYYTQSTDGGATFLTTQVPIASIASDPTLSCLATGDYMQMSAVDGIAHPFWSDTRNGLNQIFTATLDEATLAQNQMPPASLFKTIHASVGSTTGTIAVGDFNGDGKPDLVVGDSLLAGGISVLLGKGDGTFGAPIHAIPGHTGNLAVGDFNRDGKLDLAVSGSVTNALGYTTGAVFIALGNGDGTFGSPVAYPSGGALGGRLAVADLNKDGNADLVLADPYGLSAVSVLLGKGDGTFQPAVTYATGNGPNAVAIADFNGDGNLDIAATNGDSNTVSILFGKGDGTFNAAVSYAAGTRPTAITVADFNGDGRPDIAVTDGYYTNFSVLINRGDGTFFPAVSYGSGSYTGYAIASSDFDHDGKIDLAVSAQGTVQGSFVTTWLGNGDGTFVAAGTYATGTGGAEYVVADLNGDLLPDLVTADTQSNDVPILLGVTRSVVPQPGSLSFPDQVAKTAGAARTLTITNPGTAGLRIAIAEPAGLNAQDFVKVGDTCSGTTVPGGGSCAVSLKFAPKTVGNKTATLQITDDAVGRPHLVPLSGKALITWPRPETAPATISGAAPSVRGSAPPLTPGSPPGPRPQTAPLPSARGGGELQPLPSPIGGRELQPVRLLRLLLL